MTFSNYRSKGAWFATRLAAAAFLLAFSGPKLLASPSWWASRGVLVSGSATQTDFAVANQGQLKNFAHAAMQELDAKLSGGAGTAIHSVVDAWATPSSQVSDYSAVNVGQLKALSKLFYDRLIATGNASGYPWSGSSSPQADYAAANVGQMKYLFNFSIP